jgi:hypothetical protein
MRLIFAAFLLMVSSFIHGQTAPPKLYAVIFDVTVNSAGRLQTLKIAKVIDPSTHTTDAVNVPGPGQLRERRQSALDQDQLRPRSDALQHLVVLRPRPAESRGRRSEIGPAVASTDLDGRDGPSGYPAKSGTSSH